MGTNPELEAAIEKDPDDEAAYLVYGDWLQAEDDPRGELIALQAAALRDPSDKKLAKRIDKHIAQHANELLAGLEEIEVVWHLGFVRDARVAGLGALRALLAHPSGRFVQSLTVDHGVERAPVIALLQTTKQPATLADLRIGRGWDTAKDAPELFDLFPRLHRSLDVEWRRIAALVAEQRKTDLKYEPAKLPALAARPGVEPAGVDNEQILRALKLEIDKQRDVGVVAAMKRSFTPDSLDRFAVALADQFVERGEPTSLRWGFQTLGLLGDARAVTWIADRFGSWSHQRSVQGAEMLGQIRSNVALWELYGLISDPRRNRARRNESARVLDCVARDRRLDVDTLLDRSLPPVDERSSRVAESATRRLLRHMIDGRRIAQPDFVHYVVSHPTIAPLARRLVWATYDRIDVETTFRIDADGNALDVRGAPIELDGATIGVLHPAELPAGERDVVEQWKTVLAKQKIEPLFPQLDRPVLALRDQETGPVITRFKLRSVGFDQLRSILDHELDWEPMLDDNDHGPQTMGWQQVFPRDNVTAVALLTESAGGIETVTLEGRGTKIPFTRLHPVTASEILLAIDRATTRPTEAAVETAGAIEKGMRVKITRGAGRLREGVVFWIGGGNRGERVGLRTDDNETLWADLDAVRPTSAPVPKSDAPITARPKDYDEDDEREEQDEDDEAPATKPAFAKGSRVRWNKGRNTGTGTTFWIGKNKFGDGMRVGVKDDETGETVWADAGDCEPLEQA